MLRRRSAQRRGRAERIAEATLLVAQNRGADERWPLQNPHGDLLDSAAATAPAIESAITATFARRGGSEAE